jgi:hypothetical protein
MKIWQERKNSSPSTLTGQEDDEKAREAQISIDYSGFKRSLQLHNFKSSHEIVLKNFEGPLFIQGQGTGAWIFQLTSSRDQSSSSKLNPHPKWKGVSGKKSPLQVTAEVALGSFGNAELMTCQR